MTPEQFTYWLQGYMEVSGVYPTETQWKVIKDHLQTVFHKVTPQRDLIGHDPYIPTPHVTPLEITPNGTGKNPWEPPYTTTC